MRNDNSDVGRNAITKFHLNNITDHQLLSM